MHKLQLFNSLKLKAPVKVTIETTNYKPYENQKTQEPYHKITKLQTISRTITNHMAHKNHKQQIYPGIKILIHSFKKQQ
jgi:flagellar biosynthesis protein FliP